MTLRIITGEEVMCFFGKWKQIIRMLEQLKNGQEDIMATLDEILADVQAETSLIDGVSTLISGLKQQLADALAGVLTPAQQAEVDAIFAAAETNKQKLSDALVSGTPAKQSTL
jgi:NTP pyrophosphatase (non-canonical NTP hydrolase)